jgi:DNA gyrase subunit A
MAIRFSEADARAMGRNARGVKGIKLGKDDAIVGMVVADPEGLLLTVCENGYGKRTPFGANADPATLAATAGATDDGGETEPTTGEPEEADPTDENDPSGMRYRLQRRGGKGVKDVKVTAKNGKVVSINSVRDGDEIMLITAQGMVTRSKVDDIRIVGRNTQGVRVMNLNEGDKIVTVAKVARDSVAEPTAEEPKK